MLTVQEASGRILQGIAPLPPERVSLPDAPRRVLAGDIVAPLTLPPWDNSAMDGYAMRAEDVEGSSADRPVTIPVVQTIAAGEFPVRALRTGEAMRIMTGAPLPEAADSVVRV